MSKNNLTTRFIHFFMVPFTQLVGDWAHYIGRRMMDGMQERSEEIAEEESMHTCDGNCVVDSMWNGKKTNDEPKSN